MAGIRNNGYKGRYPLGNNEHGTEWDKKHLEKCEKIVELKEMIEQKNNDIMHYKAIHSIEKAKIEEKNNKIEELEGRISELKDVLAGDFEKMKDKDKRIDHLLWENAKLHKLLDRKGQECRSINKDLEDLHDKYNENIEQIEFLKTKFRALDEANKNQALMIDKRDDDICKLTLEKETLKNTCETHLKEIENLKKDRKYLKEAADKIIEIDWELRSEIASFRIRIKELEDINKELKKSNKTLTKKLKKAGRKIDELKKQTNPNDISNDEGWNFNG